MRMLDRNVSARSLAATMLWLFGVGLVLADILFIRRNDDVGHAGIVLAMFANMLYVRSLTDEIIGREQTAFDLGREVHRIADRR